VTRLGTPARSVSHLRPKDAEAWCLDNLVVARTALTRLAPGAPIWIRLEYNVPDQASVADSDPGDTFTIRRLIEAFSRRAVEGALSKAIHAGPFRLSN
jgi:hypothetical protein